MPNKPRKLRPGKLDKAPEPRLVMRFAEVRQATANDEQRSVEVVIATENPVERFDEERGLVVREVLEMDGIQLRGGRTQLPIVDSHDRATVANVLGSVRNLRVDGDELIGDAYFATDRKSRDSFQKLVDGHLTDFSITASPLDGVFVERGQEYTTRRGTTVEGPADIVSQWMPTDASLVATGADERSVVRRSYTEIPKETERMNEELLEKLVDMGMPVEIVEPEEAMRWMVGRMEDESEREELEEIENKRKRMEDDEEPEMIESMEGEEEVMKSKRMEEQIEKALKNERERVREINALSRKFSLERSFTNALLSSNVSIEVVRKKVLDKVSSEGMGDTVKITESETDKFYAAARDGLLKRAFRSAGIKRDAFGEGHRPAPGHEDFTSGGLRRMSEQFVSRMGGNINRMSQKDVAMVAMGHRPTMERHNIQRDAYHTTGSFANLLLDASNKTLLAGYEEAPFTWDIWARQASSVPDFKNINRIRFSESADLEMVPEKSDYRESQMSDSKESYQVEKFGRLFTVSWETVVNDDLDAISRIPAMQGVAARRVQNKKVYEVLTANAAMSDGVALFNASHNNLAGTPGAPSVSTLNTIFSLMMKQTGLDSSTILNLQPSYLIVPVAHSATAMQLLGSIADPSVGGSAAGNSNTLNIYGPNGQRPLQLVVEPQLDSNSADAWYVAASTNQIDTVELTFLEGEESPVLENEWDFDKDCYKYKVRQTFGVKAIDWRGLAKNAGA